VNEQILHAYKEGACRKGWFCMCFVPQGLSLPWTRSRVYAVFSAAFINRTNDVLRLWILCQRPLKQKGRPSNKTTCADEIAW